MTTIETIRAREVLDSRGNPTVEADVTLAGGGVVTSAVPTTDADMGLKVNVGIRPEDMVETDGAAFAFEGKVTNHQKGPFITKKIQGITNWAV